MGKGLLDYEDPRQLGTVGLQSRDYALAGLRGRRRRDHGRLRPRRALAERTGTPSATRRSSASTRSRRRSTSTSSPRSTWSATSTTSSPAWPRSCATPRTRPSHSRLNDIILGPLRGRQGRRAVPDAAAARAVGDPPGARPQDMLISDVGLHKLWIARMFPAHEPNTVFIANGLAGMGIALPTAIAAKLVHPDRNVVTVNGDGGFLMNVPGARDRGAAEDPDRQRDLGEPPVRLDRLEAGQEVRPPLRHRLHEPRLRQARRRLRHAGLALRVAPRTSATTCATR